VPGGSVGHSAGARCDEPHEPDRKRAAKGLEREISHETASCARHRGLRATPFSSTRWIAIGRFFRVLYSAPDGHTLMVHTIPFIANAFLYRRMPYDPLAAFEVVSLLSSSPSQLAASAHVKAGRATRDGAAS